MPATPTRTDAETRANACFDALLWSLSRPGQIRTLPQAGEAGLIEALIDRECVVFTNDPLLMPQIMRTGAAIGEVKDADHLFLGAISETSALSAVQCGSDLYPDDGATVVIRARLNSGPKLRLTGPGVDGEIEIAVDALPDGFWQTRETMIRYPKGFDLFLIDDDRVVGIPRSTKVEVL